MLVVADGGDVVEVNARDGDGVGDRDVVDQSVSFLARNRMSSSFLDARVQAVPPESEVERAASCRR